MLKPLDRALWWLLERGVGVGIEAVTGWYLAFAVCVGVAIWTFAERRSRSIWRTRAIPPRVGTRLRVDDGRVDDGRVDDGRVDDGPYRTAAVTTFHERAPAAVRITSLVGIVVGVIGFVWPAVLVLDVLGRPTALFVLLELIVVATSAVAFLGGIVILLGIDRFGRRNALLLPAIAVLLTLLSVGHLLHLFDELTVEAAGFKRWSEVMTFGAFLRSGFNGEIGGHVGATWRVFLGAASVFGLVSAGYLALWALLVWTRSTPSLETPSLSDENEKGAPTDAPTHLQK